MNIGSNLAIITGIEQLQKSEQLLEIQRNIDSQKVWSTQYPNERGKDLAECIKDSLDRVTVIGYGSLMNPGTSWAKNDEISAESYSTMREVVVFGWKRIFNWDVRVGGQFPSTYVSYENEQASLNVMPGKEAYFNAVAIDITVDELHKLIGREIGYDMVTVAYTPFERINEAREIFKKAVVFSASSDLRPSFKNPSETVVYTNNEINPRRFYFDLVSSICQYKRSKEFFELYNRTTFMADGKQSAAEWRAKVQTPVRRDDEQDQNKREAIEKIIDYESTKKEYWEKRFSS